MSNEKKWKQDDLEKDLKLAHTADQELNVSTQKHSVMDIMENIEKLREECFNKFEKSNSLNGSPNPYTQERVAKNAGICLSTYKNYLSGRSDKISFVTLRNIRDILQRKGDWNDFLEPGSIKNRQNDME